MQKQQKQTFSELRTNNEKPKIIKGVYVATEYRDKIVLQNRNYATLAELPIKGPNRLSIHGAYVCQYMRNRNRERKNEVSLWFGVDEKTHERATAKIYEENDGRDNFVIIEQPSCHEPCS